VPGSSDSVPNGSYADPEVRQSAFLQLEPEKLKMGRQFTAFASIFMVFGCSSSPKPPIARLTMTVERVDYEMASLDSIEIVLPISEESPPGQGVKIPQVPTAPEAKFLSMLWGTRKDPQRP